MKINLLPLNILSLSPSLCLCMYVCACVSEEWGVGNTRMWRQERSPQSYSSVRLGWLHSVSVIPLIPSSQRWNYKHMRPDLVLRFFFIIYVYVFVNGCHVHASIQRNQKNPVGAPRAQCGCDPLVPPLIGSGN